MKIVMRFQSDDFVHTGFKFLNELVILQTVFVLQVEISLINFSAFNTVTVAEIMKLIQEAPNKQSWLDPIQTWLLKECSDVLLPF